MTYFGILITFVLSNQIFFANGKSGDELSAVVVLFRHGDRSPLSTWPNDLYFGNSSLWPDGYGQLNNNGKERHYRLGQWFRERYDGFLPKKYNCSDIYVRSTDVDRTLMSAASNLAGLFPPEDAQVWDENIRWQPIPIHTVPKSQDAILEDKIPCPEHTRLLNELKNSEEFRIFNEEHSELYKNISEFTGFSSVDLDTMGVIFTTSTIYKGFNLTLPSWVETYWSEISALAAKHFKLSTYTPNLARLRAGPFYDYLLNHFYEIKNGTIGPKFLMLSAHDSTIASHTNALGVYPDAVPEFASTVIWELRISNSDNSHYVNMFFKNSTGLSEVTLPSCNFDCELDEFASVLGPVTATVEQWTAECSGTLSRHTNIRIFAILLVCFCCLLLLR